MSRQVASDSNVAFNLQNAPADSDSIVIDERTVLIYDAHNFDTDI
jgi:hypothetical protein